MKKRTGRGVFYAIIPALLVALFLGKWLLGIHTVDLVQEGDAPNDLPALYQDWGRVLDLYVTEGGVDYPELVKEPDLLFRFVALLAETGPRLRQDLFTSEAHELAYYINAYNALVLVGVVKNWPIASVRDVRGVIEPRPGFGFFWAQHFQLDGETVNLYDLENRMILKRFPDGRIHAALNCASRGCPSLSTAPYVAETLHEQLLDAATAFVNQERYVRVDSAQERVFVSAIFDWYQSDFLTGHASGLAGVLEWLGHFAHSPLEAEIEEAAERGYSVEALPYDWSLNSQ